MTLIAAFVRHGDYHQLADTPSAHQPFPLNEQGEAQAAAAVPLVRDALHEFGCSLCPVIDCSTLLRAWQTASILAAGLQDDTGADMELLQTDALCERGVGSAANLTEEQIESVIRNDPRYDELPAGWKSASSFCLPLPGAESLLDAGRRVATHVEKALSELQQAGTSNQIKLFVGHGGAFRHAALHMGILKADDIPRLSMHHARPVFLQFEAGGKWRHIGGEWKIRGRKEAHRD